MSKLPFMMMNWGRFFGDPKVALLDPEAQGIYAILLGRMWVNEGLLPADDRVLCRMIGLDIRRWRSVYKPVIVPLLRRETLGGIGDFYSQKHLQEVRQSSLAISEKNVQRTAAARAVIAAKRGRKPTVTERAPRPVTKPVTDMATALSTDTVTSSKEQTQQKELSSALQAESLVPIAPPSTDTALPPRVVGVPEPAALALMGRLQAIEGASPFTDYSAPLAGAPTPITKRLVEDGLKPKRGGLLGSLDMGKR